jgi:hypothetical protein
MDLENFQNYKFPIVLAKSFKSELYHTRKISDIVMLFLNELPIKREFSKFNRAESYKSFKKGYKTYLQKQFRISSFKENDPKNVEDNDINAYRTKILDNIEMQRNLVKLGKINVILNK